MPVKTLAGWIHAAVDLVLPPRCLGTGEIVDAPGMLSPAFWPELQFIVPPLCAHCGMPFPSSAAAGDSALCGACIESEPAFDAARAAVAYNAAARDILLAFKYGDKLHAVRTFVPWLQRAGAGLIAESTLLAPVPLHPMRLWRRRFNQSALLAQDLARATGKPCALDLLRRIRATSPQKGLGRQERRENVRGAFAVHDPKRRLTGAQVLLIDDVFTTGATLNECARTLKSGGAARVSVLTIARVTQEEL